MMATKTKVTPKASSSKATTTKADSKVSKPAGKAKGTPKTEMRCLMTAPSRGRGGPGWSR